MSKTANIRARVEPELKTEVENILFGFGADRFRDDAFALSADQAVTRLAL